MHCRAFPRQPPENLNPDVHPVLAFVLTCSIVMCYLRYSADTGSSPCHPCRRSTCSGCSRATYRRGTAQTLFDKLFADIALEPGLCTVALKKRNRPALLETVAAKETGPIHWPKNRRLVFAGASRT